MFWKSLKHIVFVNTIEKRTKRALRVSFFGGTPFWGSMLTYI